MKRKLCVRTEFKRVYKESPTMTVIGLLALLISFTLSAALIASHSESAEVLKLEARQ